MPTGTSGWEKVGAVVDNLRLVALLVVGVAVLGQGLAKGTAVMIGAGLALLGLVALMFMTNRPSSHRGDDPK